MLRVLMFVLPIVISVYSVVDCIQTAEDRVRGLPKIVWVFVIMLFPLVGSAAWWLAGRPSTPRLLAPRPPDRPRGPDDDPDFLRKL